MQKIELKTGPWFLKDLDAIPKTRGKVFSCFHCGGGSTMGYKLAGFDVLGGVEIDPEMMAIYRANHKPKHSYLMGVQQFKKIPDSELPAELFDLDILDGSPPCSSFSMAGSREKKWGKASKFREGQSVQRLDDLFFDFIDIAKKLQPKIVIAENVKGLIQGNARGYVKQIFQAFREAGYSCQLFLLNAANMGVPQRRERTFFIANRLGKKINLDFREEPIPFSSIFNGKVSQARISLKRFGDVLIDMSRPISTIATINRYFVSNSQVVDSTNLVACQSFPTDFNFVGHCQKYVCGMSVPPFMMQRVADQVYKQLLAGVTNV